MKSFWQKYYETVVKYRWSIVAGFVIGGILGSFDVRYTFGEKLYAVVFATMTQSVLLILLTLLEDES